MHGTPPTVGVFKPHKQVMKTCGQRSDIKSKIEVVEVCSGSKRNISGTAKSGICINEILSFHNVGSSARTQ